MSFTPDFYIGGPQPWPDSVRVVLDWTDETRWYVPEVSLYSLQERATCNAWTIKRLKDENAKLRELVRIAIEYCVNGYCEEEDECPLYESRHSCRLHAEARELGVEVDE